MLRKLRLATAKTNTLLMRLRDSFTSIFRDEQFKYWLKFWTSYAISRILADLFIATVEAFFAELTKKLRY